MPPAMLFVRVWQKELSMLERFRAAKRDEIQKLETLVSRNAMPHPLTEERPSFSNALQNKKISVIAEYKRASPSKGNINLAISPSEVAMQYAENGANALSVLTEQVHFRGDLNFLSQMTGPKLPLLRKDFLFHPLQIVQTAATPASALLLIARMFCSEKPLRELVQKTHDHGLEAVVEIFDERDLEFARKAGAKIIQVNNRNLDTLKTDLAICERLVQDRANTEVWIAASGITKPEHRRHVESLGYDAMLVGTALMQEGVPGQALTTLLS